MEYKYDELSYAEKIYKEGFQTDFIKYELILLVKYLKQEKNFKVKETEDYLYNFCEKYIPNFNKVLYFPVIDKALKEGRKRKNKLIIIKKIDILESELKYIDELEIEKNNSLNKEDREKIDYDYKKILVAFLLNKKINNKINSIRNSNPDEKISIYFEGSARAYNKIIRLSNLEEKHDINLIINKLIKADIIKSLNKGNILLSYIEKIPIGNSNIFYELPPNGFNNLGYVFDYYKGKEDIKKCEKCEVLIKTKNNKRKYCKKCAREIKQEQDRIADKKYKNKIKARK